MKRSRVVTLTILLAIIASACEEKQNDLKHCVDENGVVVEEKHCDGVPNDAAPPSLPLEGGTQSTGSHGGGHFWYFGGTSTPVSPGGRVSGGSFSPSPGRSYSPPSVGVSRGGFGATGAGQGGGGGGE